jgi:methylmalonyl-CoA mutase
MADSLVLGAEFPAATRDEWRALVAEVLAKSGKTGDPEQELSFRTYDDIAIKPLYTADDAPAASGLPGRPPYTRGATEQRTGWDVRTRHADQDPARLNRAARADLDAGATSLWLVLGAGGLAVEDLAAALAGVDLAAIPVVLQPAGPDAHPQRAEQALLTLGEQAGVDPARLRGSAGADPIGNRARTGAPADLDALLTLSEQSKAAAHRHLVTVDGTVYHDAGGSDAQELGIATAVAVGYLRALTDAGLDLADALARIEFRWAVTADQFGSIGKLRAARRLWHRVAELSGAGDTHRGQVQHAVTSAVMLTRRDPWVNMLRTTIGCFAAAVGGADAVTVAPFDAAIGVSDDFARRIARNTQAILHDESSLARVVDAAGGSWYVESLTEQLAERAWDVFTQVERAGGALRALDDGLLDDLVADTRTKRADDIAHRRAPITGVSEFAFVGEPPVEREALPTSPDGALPTVRYAQDFEALRDRSDRAAQRPRVYLATLGPFAAHSARAGFAANLFQAAGIECVTGPVEQYAGTPVACLCSSDKLYAEQAEDAAQALRSAGAQQIWLAGKGEYAGVDGTVYAGCDALAVLRGTLAALEVAE